MTIQPWWKGQTRPSWSFTIRKTDNTALDITGTTFVGSLREVRTGLVKALSSGGFAITTAAEGKFTYSPTTAETNQAGTWDLLITLDISSQAYIVGGRVVISETF